MAAEIPGVEIPGAEVPAVSTSRNNRRKSREQRENLAQLDATRLLIVSGLYRLPV